MKKKILLIVGVLVIVIAIFSPKIYRYIDDELYFSNHIVTYGALAEFTILDKYTEGDNYFIKINLDSQFFIDKYQIKDNERIYTLEDNKELYDKIDLDRSEDYLGLQFESVIPTRSISKQEAKIFRIDPLRVISKQEFSKFIKIIDISS